MVAASEAIELFCFILGDEPNNVFPIQIEKDKTVGNMKVKIKDENKHALRGIDAKSLVLWMVSNFHWFASVQISDVFCRWTNHWTPPTRNLSDASFRKTVVLNFKNWCHGSLCRVIGHHSPPVIGSTL